MFNTDINVSCKLLTDAAGSDIDSNTDFYMSAKDDDMLADVTYPGLLLRSLRSVGIRMLEIAPSTYPFVAASLKPVGGATFFICRLNASMFGVSTMYMAFERHVPPSSICAYSSAESLTTLRSSLPATPDTRLSK